MFVVTILNIEDIIADLGERYILNTKLYKYDKKRTRHSLINQTQLLCDDNDKLKYILFSCNLNVILKNYLLINDRNIRHVALSIECNQLNSFFLFVRVNVTYTFLGNEHCT